MVKRIKVPTSARVDTETDGRTWEELKKGMTKVELAHHEESVARLKRIVTQTQAKRTKP